MKPSVNLASNQERIISLDIMRGFAILGIFLVNMLSFHSPFLYINPSEWWSSPADKATYTFIDIFAQASFYPLFALLFGYGLVIMRERSILKGLHFNRIVFRRLSLLLVIGLLHAIFIWHGDILVTYAVMGFLFLLFMGMKGRNLIITGALLYVIPNLLLTLFIFIGILFAPEYESTLYEPAQVEASIQAYQSGSFIEITVQRFNDWYSTNNLATFPIMIISIFPLFLIGGGAAKLKWLEEPKKNRKILSILVIATLIPGFIIKFLPYLSVNNLATEYIQDIFGGPLVAIGYGVGIALLIEKAAIQKVLHPLSYVGKLSMSNYLLQSVISTLVFYNYGLGLYGKVSALTGTVMVIGIYLFQIVISRIWINRYYYGPVEWIWRGFTYLQFPRWKR